MNENQSLEGSSVFSSIAEVPAHFVNQYSPLDEIIQDHPAHLPDCGTPEPNSHGNAVDRVTCRL